MLGHQGSEVAAFCDIERVVVQSPFRESLRVMVDNRLDIEHPVGTQQPRHRFVSIQSSFYQVVDKIPPEWSCGVQC